MVFFNKGGMWLCCGPSNHYSKNIGFNNYIKAVAIKLVRTSLKGIYNAGKRATLTVVEAGLIVCTIVHVRRGGGHTSSDRRTANGYFKAHLTKFNKSVPLYIATDEKDKTWFAPLQKKHGFQTLLFWSNLDKNIIEDVFSKFPSTMHGDLAVSCCLVLFGSMKASDI